MRIEDCGGYQTSFGPAVAYSNLWVNEWLGMYTDPVAKIGDHLRKYSRSLCVFFRLKAAAAQRLR